MGHRPITLSDIALRLNFSIVTISKALRDHPDISPKTTKLVKSAAKEMGYTPNLMARGLSARKSHTIGVVVPKIAHFFFGSIIESIYKVAFDNNYEIILMVSQENAEIEKKHIQTLMAMKVDGIIISITQETKDYDIFETVRKRSVPLVFMDRIPEIEDINIVRVCDREGAFKAIEHAINLGYKRIAHFAGYDDINIGKLRYQGYAEAMEKYQLPIHPDWVVRGGFGDKYGYEAFMKLYNENNLPDLIFCVTYPVALGVYQAARELNIKIPDDVDVICFGNAKVQNFLNPPLSCIDQPTEQIAERSMEILLENINNPEESEKREIIVPTDLILRGTCISYNKP
ncbi:MAG: LacI family transcriptional regulator [Bacteroidetes bacterium]|nr:LacI family transcriptional regulator [Bacteroidota bacterium]